MKNLLLLMLIVFTFKAQASTITWVGGTSNQWNDTSNWDIGQIPTVLDDVVIGNLSLPFQFVSIFTANAVAKSLTIENGQVSIANTRSLVVSGVNIFHPTSVHLEFGAIQNNGVFEYRGGLYALNSTLTNANTFIINGDQDNTPISMELDNSFWNNINPLSVAFFQNNIESTTGNNKDALIVANNSSTIINNGGIANNYNATTNDWVNKGMVINNNSTVTNLTSSAISFTSVREIGIHIKNDSNVTPISKFINRGTLSISKCTTCNYGEFTCGIRTEENAKYEDYPITSTVNITDYTDVNDSDVCIFGTIGSFGSLGGAAVNMGNYSFDPTAVLQGTGVIIIDDGMSSSFSGTITPGLVVGKMIFQGPFTSTSSTVFQMQLEGNGEGGMMMGYDQIDWGTDETSLSMSTLQVDLTGGFIPDVGDQFQLFMGTAIAGEFENLDLPGDDSSWEITYGVSADGSAEGVFLTVIAPISNINNIGIGTASPRTKLEVNGGDVLLSSIGTGVVLTSPGGSYYKVTVDDNGQLQTELIPCPEVWECP